ncbi:hypothetical protein, partial [Brevibacillus borstelensis]|uniref:hypothetical protein n=1 Tax=Brevibacillus borstelensis TaxID=45462 RepID=UPI00203E1827
VLYRENYHDSPPFFHQFSRTVCPSSAGQLMPSTGGHYVLAVTIVNKTGGVFYAKVLNAVVFSSAFGIFCFIL